MIRLLLPLGLAAAWTACSSSLPPPAAGGSSRGVLPSSAIALDEEIRRLVEERPSDDPLWPGFDPLAVPLAVFDGASTWFFRHPSPPGPRSATSGSSSSPIVLVGRHEAVTANTSVEIGGVPTATILLDPADPIRSIRDLAAIAIHEAFHVFQRARHPGWIANEGDLFTYPVDSAELLVLRRLETEALRLALSETDGVDAACWTRRALALRAERYANLDSAFADYERGTELNEGLATYVEVRASGRSGVEFPPGGFGLTEVRRRGYATGGALGLLLDRFDPGWRERFETDDRQVLDGALAEALGPGDRCAFDAATVADMERAANEDVRALARERERRLEAFEGKPGWRVVIDAGEEPLWPQGFDPLNVERIGPARVLHSRYLRAGNDGGRLEVLDAESLTEGVGPHPLFQGIQRVVVSGLAEPVSSVAGDRVLLHAPGLTVEFRGASISRIANRITIRTGARSPSGRASLDHGPVGEDEEVYLQLVSVGCAPATGDRVRYVWHTEVPGLSTEESTRAFKELASPDVERCLSSLVRAEPGLYDRLLALGPEAPDEESDRVLTEVRSVWARRGVAQAFAEVAKTGRRGPLLTALLDTCASAASGE